ncbi:hypothetical protein [Hymenobacter cellulosilyticus]|uniref:DUF4138 domain-containing protein n=1 Tax=Hymenobacter cellulosilyticus TaxID=2932248 RepID=A0A8T9Q834_9BACT|nr:hypothetical protein [Hymenobacter cellulosilyticus]UOQ71679.1 hypothetical protein MUN79_24220 [Hymenobacter cellulosilyticus]
MNRRYSLRTGAVAALLALGALTSCGPSYYLTVKPQQPDSEWPDGRPSLSTNFDSVEVQVCYSHVRDKELMFEVEIRNGSLREVAVNPGTFYYMPIMLDRKTAKQNAVKLNANVPYVPAQVYAVDPEYRIKVLSAKLEAEARKANGISIWDWMSVVSTVAEELTPVKGTEQEKQQELQRREERRISDAAFAEQQHIDHAIKADQAVLEKQYWEVKILRKHILKSGELVHGYVTFPVYDQTLQLRVAMPLGERTLLFDFDQERKKVGYGPAPTTPVVASRPSPPVLEAPSPPKAAATTD